MAHMHLARARMTTLTGLAPNGGGFPGVVVGSMDRTLSAPRLREASCGHQRHVVNGLTCESIDMEKNLQRRIVFARYVADLKIECVEEKNNGKKGRRGGGN